ncbi:hypothetical protein E2562_033701 [Oryza meyeriana var. granulata]|uniref:rRNA N-glycosylase n=1 Tax=Oryza meyeriana var. granulata TaxID=110450 RepID=A0A6G1DRJ8_9ORYZ|nr:hypothetical protein E2562_033701 [Oryza meyeriana var. granulata]
MANFHAALLLVFFLLNLAADHQGEVLSLADGLFGVSLNGADGDEAHVAVHHHDLSFAGFTNRSGHWHVFRGDEDVLPTARPLPFRNTYCDLIGGLTNVPDLPLGRASALRAIRALSFYDPDTAGDEETAAVKRAVAAMSVMLTQTKRLKPIRETVSNGWESEARVAAEHLPYIEHWDTMSFELVRWDHTGAWDGPFTELLRKSANIRTAEKVLAIADVLANPTLPQLLLAHSRSA